MAKPIDGRVVIVPAQLVLSATMASKNKRLLSHGNHRMKMFAMCDVDNEAFFAVLGSDGIAVNASIAASFVDQALELSQPTIH